MALRCPVRLRSPIRRTRGSSQGPHERFHWSRANSHLFTLRKDDINAEFSARSVIYPPYFTSCDMAIPFNWPSDEETEDHYRRLDQLLLDLYDVLRQILLRRRLHPVPQPEAQPVPLHEHLQPQGLQRQQLFRQARRPDLPDLIPSAANPIAPLSRKPPVPPPRRRRRRSDAKHHSNLQEQQQSHQQQHHSLQHRQESAAARADSAIADLQQGPSWLNVGIELRQIAEEFRSAQIDGSEEKSRKEIKASSLFSLLVPAPLTGSIWTTVIILVGWRILARNR